MNHFSKYGFALAIGTLSACQSLPAPSLAIAPASDTVRVIPQPTGYQFRLVSKVVNRSNAVVSLDRCNYSVQVSDGTQWRSVDGAICAGDLGSWVIRPGDSLEIPVTVYDDRSYQILWRRGPLKSGKYRVKFGGRSLQPGRLHSKRRTFGFYTSDPFDVSVQSPTPPPNTR